MYNCSDDGTMAPWINIEPYYIQAILPGSAAGRVFDLHLEGWEATARYKVKPQSVEVCPHFKTCMSSQLSVLIRRLKATVLCDALQHMVTQRTIATSHTFSPESLYQTPAKHFIIRTLKNVLAKPSNLHGADVRPKSQRSRCMECHEKSIS